MASSINPHMRVGTVDPDHAKAQHEAFVRTLEALGATVTYLPFVHGGYDSVFAKDNAVVIARGGRRSALMAHPLDRERRSEQEARAAAFEAHGIRVHAAPATALEGGDVVVHGGARHAFLGYGFRSSVRSVSALERFLDVPVVPLELRDPSLYHLDMAVMVLEERTLACVEALTTKSVRALESAVGRDSLVHVSIEDARRFALNTVRIGNHVVLASGASSFEKSLRRLGHEPRAVDLTQFHRAGGSAACLVSECHVQSSSALLGTDAA